MYKTPPYFKKGEQDLMLTMKEINENLYNLSTNVLYQKWLPKKAVMQFLDYGETQMRVIEKQHKLQVSKIKARTFYSVESVLNLLELHKIK
jgi:hypothetical protein